MTGGDVPSEPVRLGVAMLCHAKLDRAAQMARHWHEGGAALAIHVDRRTSPKEVAAMRAALADLPDIVWVRRRACDWGRFSLVEAEQDCAAALLDGFPDVSHVYLASGSCLPLRPLADLVAYLAHHQGTDFIESVSALDVGWTVGGLNLERFTLFFPFSWRRSRRAFDRFTDLQRRLRLRRRVPQGVVPHLGSQWWCLTRPTLEAILNDPRREEFDRYFRWSWIPDESYFQSLIRRHGARIESRSLTLSKFDDQGKPYVFYDDHAEMLESSRCFAARKIWPGATALFERFPRPAASPPRIDEPAPARMDRLINRAVERRRLGRPGLYMQSRFPGKDRENGKTAAAYGVLQGFSDLFPAIETWLAQRIDADIHGHIFGPVEVEFANRPEIGPGGLSTHVESRDYDPTGFFTSLIRISDRRVVLQHSPRDLQALNWFMATDPNATMRIVTGAWVVPLMHSEMPFDDVKRIAAKLQRIEAEQLGILRSVWVKADVEIWTLADFLARPAALLQTVVRDLGTGQFPLYDQPPAMRDLDGLGRFLQRLRNAGLQLWLTGDIPATASEETHG